MSEHCILVMPAYNEAACIESVVRNWHRELRVQLGSRFGMVLVNDGSKDETPEILDQLAGELPELRVVHQKNAGHGAALRRAYEEAIKLEPTFVFHVDSDDQFEPSDFSSLWKNRERSKFILGHRKTRHDALHRLVISRILKTVVLTSFGVWVADLNVPYRLIRTDYLRALLDTIPEDVFAPNIFLSVLAARDGQDVLSLPVTHRERKTGEVSIVRLKLLKVCFRTFKELLAFRLNIPQSLERIRNSQHEVRYDPS